MGRARSKRMKDLLRVADHKEREEKKTQRKRSANNILLTYSYTDNQKIIGEIVFEPKSEKIVRAKLSEEFGYIPQYVFSDRDYGEVLNAPSNFLPPTVTKYTESGVQNVQWTFEN